MTRKLSFINISLALGILLLLILWTGLIVERMSSANVLGQLEADNQKLKSEVSALSAQFTAAVAREQRALLAEGTLQQEASPAYAYRHAGAGVALARTSR